MAELHPLDMVSVTLNQSRPRPKFQNKDVAFIPVTRFNLRMNMSRSERFGHLGTRNLYESPEYDAYWRPRVAIFERVCLPSVLNMVPRPHAWYIAFGEMRPPYIRDLIERLSEHPWIVPYLRTGTLTEIDDPLPAMLTEHLQRLGKSFLCSTRFDSDDSLHQQFYGALDRAITRLRSDGYPDETRCLNLPYGLADDRGALSVFVRRSNMFESVFEPVEVLKGPYRGPHDEARKRMPLVEVMTNLPMFIYHRHDASIDPPRAMAADRLPLTDIASIYPMFGLDPNEAPNRPEPVAATQTQTNAVQRTDPDVPADQASELRAAPRWSERQRSAAIALARSMGLNALAAWLDAATLESVELNAVWLDIESADLSFLNSEHYSLLAYQLRNEGDPLRALLAYERACVLAPASRHLREIRQELMRSALGDLDAEEQIELGLLLRGDAEPNVFTLVVSPVSDDAADLAIQPVQARIEGALLAGMEVLVLMLPEPGDDTNEGESFEQDGVRYELLPAPDAETTGKLGWQRACNLTLATRLASNPPGLLAADGSAAAQLAAATVARAFGLVLDLSRPEETVATHDPALA